MKYMKKIVFVLLILLIAIPNVKAENIVDIHLFYSELCVTCAAEEKWLAEYIDEVDNVNIIRYEVSRNDENAKLLSNVRKKLNDKKSTTPYTVIGTTGITGFSETVKNQIKSAVEKYKNEQFVDIVDVVINDLDVDYEINSPEGMFNIPILGDVDPKMVSLPLVSIIIGFIDGFNPCAMWVLLFLISLLLNMKNRKKMWVIGLTFLITSALVYLTFMLAWLQIAITLTQIAWVRFLIALVALIGSAINITSYIKERKKEDGCQVVDEKRRKSLFKRMKNIINRVDSENNLKIDKGFILALIGVVGLAISVNLIELACSSGLPLIFTQILAYNNLTGLQYFIYILLYIIFFLLDDIVIFTIAMKTLKLTGISTKYNKLSHLIGGIVMLIIGLLMIFKPEWIMFNF